MDLCVKPECKKEFFTEQLKWMPLPVCDAHKQEFIASKVSGIEWKPGQCCKDRLKYLKRKPGLFKTEHESQKMVALGPKSYFCHSEFRNKQVSKGICIPQNQLSFKQYHHVLTTNTTLFIENRGFRTKDHQVYSYTQKKTWTNVVLL